MVTYGHQKHIRKDGKKLTDYRQTKGRNMTKAEMIEKYGAEYYERFKEKQRNRM